MGAVGNAKADKSVRCCDKAAKQQQYEGWMVYTEHCLLLLLRAHKHDTSWEVCLVCLR